MKRTKIFKSVLAVFTLLLIASIGMLGLTTSPNMNQPAHASALNYPIINAGDSGKFFNKLPEFSNEIQLVASHEASEDAFPNVVIDTIPDQIYNGEEPNPKVVVRDGDKILVEGEDYTIQIFPTLTYVNEFRRFTVYCYGKNEYMGMVKSVDFYVFYPEPRLISFDLDVPTEKNFANDEEWSTFVEDNLSLSFGINDHKITLSQWKIARSYIDTTKAHRLDNGELVLVYGVIEIDVNPAFNKSFALVTKYDISQNYIGSINSNTSLYFRTDKNYYSFPIIMACSILGVVFISAICYYVISLIKKKNKKKTK